jgi:hypothetical protein
VEFLANQLDILVLDPKIFRMEETWRILSTGIKYILYSGATNVKSVSVEFASTITSALKIVKIIIEGGRSLGFREQERQHRNIINQDDNSLFKSAQMLSRSRILKPYPRLLHAALDLAKLLSPSKKKPDLLKTALAAAVRRRSSTNGVGFSGTVSGVNNGGAILTTRDNSIPDPLSVSHDPTSQPNNTTGSMLGNILSSASNAVTNATNQPRAFGSNTNSKSPSGSSSGGLEMKSFFHGVSFGSSFDGGSATSPTSASSVTQSKNARKNNNNNNSFSGNADDKDEDKEVDDFDATTKLDYSPKTMFSTFQEALNNNYMIKNKLLARKFKLITVLEARTVDDDSSNNRLDVLDKEDDDEDDHRTSVATNTTTGGAAAAAGESASAGGHGGSDFDRNLHRVASITDSSSEHKHVGMDLQDDNVGLELLHQKPGVVMVFWEDIVDRMVSKMNKINK